MGGTGQPGSPSMEHRRVTMRNIVGHGLALLTALTLAACVAAPLATPQPVVGEVLPVEAQRVIDRATATAGAIGTLSAQATATAVSARETSTAASLSTHNA